VQERDLEQSEEMQPHHHDDRAADHRQDIGVAGDEATEHRGGRAHGDEYCRKAQNEGSRRKHHGPPGNNFVGVARQLIEGPTPAM
jgi:hypothetical protein